MSQLEVEISRDPCNLLIIVLDLAPAIWGLCSADDFGLPKVVEAVLGLANSHLILSSLNEICIIGVTPDKTEFLYPSHLEVPSDLQQNGQLDLLNSMNNLVRRQVAKMVQTTALATNQVILAGAIIKGLCYYLRRCRELQPIVRQTDETVDVETEVVRLTESVDKINGRMVIIKVSDDCPSQYLSLMNAVFTAQKLHVPMDTCILPSPQFPENPSSNRSTSCLPKHSSLLQQAADLTGGIYLQIPRLSGLLQYLLSVFLPAPKFRPHFLLPDSHSSRFSSGVDFRAACFCHKRLIDIGYVCSVCLSIFCEFTPICTTCNSAFVVPGVQMK